MTSRAPQMPQDDPKKLRKALRVARNLRRRSEAANAAVRAFHRRLSPYAENSDCPVDWCYGCMFPWPCPTIQAIDKALKVKS